MHRVISRKAARLFCTLVSLSLMVLVMSCYGEPKELSEVDVEAAKVEVLEALNEAYLAGQRGDLEALAEGHLYGPGFTRFDDGVRIDASGTREMEDAFFSAPDNRFEFEVVEPMVDLLSADIAIVTYYLDWTARIQAHDYRSRNQATFVMKRLEGHWKIAHENFSYLDGFPEVVPVE